MFTPRPSMSLLIAATTVVLTACDAFATPIDPDARLDSGSPFFGDAGRPRPPEPMLVGSVPPPNCPVDYIPLLGRTPEPNAVDVDVNTAIALTFGPSLPSRYRDEPTRLELRVDGDEHLIATEIGVVGSIYQCQPVNALRPGTRYRVTMLWDFGFACGGDWAPSCEERTWTFTTGGIASDADAGVDDAGTDDDAGTQDFDCY